MARKLAILGAAWVLCATACSGESQHSTGNGAGGTSSGGRSGQSSAGSTPHAGAETFGPNTPAEDFPRAYAQGVCQLLIRCYAAAATAIPADCTTYFERLFREQTFPHVFTAIAEGRIEYHAAAVQECVEQVAAASCDVVLLPDCSRVLVGTKQTGEACTLDLECVDQQCQVDGACPGACAPPGALGATCTAENGCQPELDCLADPQGNLKCGKTAAVGEACSRDVPCRGYTFCSGRDADVADDTGICVNRESLYTGKLGEACESITEPLCEPSLVCTTRVEAGITVGSCQPRVAAGSACTYSTPDACPATQYCRITSDVGVKPATGTCTPKPGLAEECRYGSYSIAPCPDGQFCDLDSKLCAEHRHLDEACGKNQECYSNRCSAAGKCVALLECEKSAEP